VVSHTRQGQNRQFMSPFVLLLSGRTCVAAGEATPYAEHAQGAYPRPASSLSPRAQLLSTPISPDLLGFPCPASTPPLDRDLDRGQASRISRGGGVRRRPRWRPVMEAASSSPLSPTRSEAAVTMVSCTRCVVGGGRPPPLQRGARSFPPR
jgi:hypothetical protein